MLGIIGAIFTVVIAYQLLGGITLKAWGTLISVILAGAGAAIFIFKPEVGLEILMWIGGLFTR